MSLTHRKNSVFLMLCFTAFSVIAKQEHAPNSEAYLNGVKTLVRFNDGDTFKILDGKYKNKRVRIAGFNALESYGPVHEWLGNDAQTLYENSKLATIQAQNGTWHCDLDTKHDTYGRLLATCDDLALALIDKGLAHAYSVDENRADENYLNHQRQAQANKIGMWKHGVPTLIITSLHSSDEGSGRNNYNRAISTIDGHSEKIYHQEIYGTCQKVCLDNENSCMTYVPFNARYGKHRPECLLRSPAK